MMSLFLTHHPWSGGSMGRDEILALVRAKYQTWMASGVQWHGYMGTPQEGEGWSLFSSPDASTLIAVLHQHGIPYLYIRPVWQVAESDLKLTRAQSAGSSADRPWYARS